MSSDPSVVEPLYAVSGGPDMTWPETSEWLRPSEWPTSWVSVASKCEDGLKVALSAALRRISASTIVLLPFHAICVTPVVGAVMPVASQPITLTPSTPLVTSEKPAAVSPWYEKEMLHTA